MSLHHVVIFKCVDSVLASGSLKNEVPRIMHSTIPGAAVIFWHAQADKFYSVT